MKRGATIRISKGRFEAFSDGVFAIAITLLVLSFQPPKLTAVNETAMTSALLALWPQYLVYATTFATVGIMWFNHYALFHGARHVSYSTLIVNLALLMLVAFLPFPTLLLGEYGLLSTLVFFYSLVMVVISVCFGILYYVAKLQADERVTLAGYIRSRTAWNTVGPVAYAAAALLAFASPLTSVFLIASLAIFYMLPSTVSLALAASADDHSDI